MTTETANYYLYNWLRPFEEWNIEGEDGRQEEEHAQKLTHLWAKSKCYKCIASYMPTCIPGTWKVVKDSKIEEIFTSGDAHRE